MTDTCGWEKMSGEIMSDNIMQALVKESAPEKIKGQVETATFVRFEDLKKSLITLCLMELSRIEASAGGGGINAIWNPSKGKGKETAKGKKGRGKKGKGKDGKKSQKPKKSKKEVNR